MKVLKYFSIVAVVLGSASASAVPVSVDWTTAGTGTLNGTSVSVTDLGSAFLDTSDLSGADYSGAPLSATAEVLDYDTAADWTASFAAPVTDLLLYGRFWRGVAGGSNPVTYTFDRSFTILSGFSGASVSGGNTVLSLPTDQFHDGILLFSGAVTSLSVVGSDVCPPLCSAQAMTFGVDVAAVPAPGVAALLLVALPLLLLARRRR